MKLSRTRIAVFISLPVTAVLIWLSGFHQYLTFENLQENREMLFSYVEQNYAFSVFTFLSLYIMTAFFIPGTLVLTVASGFFSDLSRASLIPFLGPVWERFWHSAPHDT